MMWIIFPFLKVQTTKRTLPTLPRISYRSSIIFDDDCPEMTEEMLSQFHRTDMVTIQISPVNMKKVKSFGADYSKILSQLSISASNSSVFCGLTW